MKSKFLDMNEFVGIVPFLRIALGFDMKTMHFHIAETWDAR